MLGKARCEECGGTKTLEVVADKYTGQGLIRSRCLNCGFIEDIWLFGDEPAYLNKLAIEYGITVLQLKKALAPYCKTPTEIQKGILQTLKHLNPFFTKLYHVALILAMDDGRTLRLHTRHPNRKVINIDITYHRIPDLFQIKATQVNGLTMETKTLADINDVYGDQIDETIHQILHKHADTPLNYI